MTNLHARLVTLSFVAVGVPIFALACKKGPVEREALRDAGPPPLDSAACRALYEKGEAEGRLVWEQTPKDCVTADDCVSGSQVGCYGSDCGAFPIAKRGVAEYQAGHARIDATTCKRFREGDCYLKVPIAMPSCAMHWPACVGGRCVDGHGLPPK